MKHFHKKYLSKDLVYYKLNQFETVPVNADQRLTHDIAMFAADWAEVISKSLDTPVQLIYYNILSWRSLGWIGMIFL